MTRTESGSLIYTEFEDANRNSVRVQFAPGDRWKSGGKPARKVMLVCKDPGYASTVILRIPVLTPAQARRVAKALLRFAEGEE